MINGNHRLKAAVSPADGEPILTAVNLSKSYENHQALRGLSFSLDAGHILGFLGPNGAGKTTAIRILTTILEPSAGYFTVDGTASDKPSEIRQKIGVLPESLGFPKQLTGTEFLTYFGRHYGRPTADAKTNAAALMAEVGLAKRANSLIGSYSRGMRQRLGIARALVNNPVVVFLDEPTLGLDPRGKQELLELIRKIARQRRAAVILCSHLLTEVEEVCDDVIILRLGQVVGSGPVAQVVENAKRKVTRIQVPAMMLTMAREQILTIGGVTAVHGDGSRTNGSPGWLEIDTEFRDSETHDIHQQILGRLIGADIPVLNFDTGSGRLEDVFFQLTEEPEA